jgi:hypothetical protein
VAEAVSERDTETLPEATDAAAVEAVEGEQPHAGPRRLSQPPPQDYRSRFAVVYAGLAAIVALAAIGLVVLLARPSSEPTQAWSAWEPESREPLARAQEIANEVGASYHLPSGSQLVYVQAEAPQVQSIPVAAVAIRTTPDGSTFTGEGIPVFSADETMVYILCGLGSECSIDEGEPTQERQRLLRREALELALYTFRYVDGIDYVVAFMPPRPGYPPSYALFFQRPELKALLDQPIRETLPQVPPPLPDDISPIEVNVIDALTQPRFFAFAFQQLQDGQAVMVLEDPSRVPPPEPIESTTETPLEDGTATETRSSTDSGSGTETTTPADTGNAAETAG